jgi:hypothetical protein
MILRITAFLLILFSATTGAEARRHHHHYRAAPVAEPSCGFWLCTTGPAAATRQRTPQVALRRVAGTVVGHPLGCPARAFCGCGASVRVFGHPVRSLYLAANWLRFPHVPAHAAQPGMVAARRGHVFVLESHISGNTWLVYDANSGGHATRIHARPLSGYAVVNPRA